MNVENISQVTIICEFCKSGIIKYLFDVRNIQQAPPSPNNPHPNKQKTTSTKNKTNTKTNKKLKQQKKERNKQTKQNQNRQNKQKITEQNPHTNNNNLSKKLNVKSTDLWGCGYGDVIP